ncbi:MAG: hemerythrin family protein [Nitrospinae bacterium]|nr:hemerythrin family protein [Nitrospinota bacterium]
MLASSLSVKSDYFIPREQKLFDIVELLNRDADLRTESANAPFEAITALLDYTKSELAWEEKVMKDAQGAEEHKREHDYFRSTVMSYVSMVQFGNSPPASEVRDFIGNWIQSHVMPAEAATTARA